MKTFNALAAAGLAAAAVYAVPAFAHHSFAMFDATKTVTLEGSIKEFQWTNPHAWILVNVNNDQWAIEMNGPGALVRDGWKPKTLTPGHEGRDADPSAARWHQWRPVLDRKAPRRKTNGPRRRRTRRRYASGPLIRQPRSVRT